jgi:Phosphotransferase enzyme family
VRTHERASGSLDEFLAAATAREPLAHSDGKSGARFERLTIDGDRYVLKHLALDDDWIMRATGDLACRPVVVWEAGLLDQLPTSIDHAIVAAARQGRGGLLLMRDVGEHLVPEGDERVPLEQHLRFLDHLAELHATFWGWDDHVGLACLETRYLEFCPAVSECEARRDTGEAVPRVIGEGWRRLPMVAPRAAPIVLALVRDIGPLVRAMGTTPTTFLHGDWKLGNLGSHPDGRTILLDWAVPGAGPPCADFAWYLALNRARLPVGHTKEDATDAYRAALARHGIDTDPWWDTQLALCLLGAFVQFGWEKALGDAEELGWWEERALQGARHLQ